MLQGFGVSNCSEGKYTKILVFQTIKEVILMFKAARSGDIIFFPEQDGGQLPRALTKSLVSLDGATGGLPEPTACSMARACKGLPSAFCDLQGVTEPQARIQGYRLPVPIDGGFLMCGSPFMRKYFQIRHFVMQKGGPKGLKPKSTGPGTLGVKSSLGREEP